jgi:hypothetical protein
MANKNRNVVIAYYESLQKANAAIEQLREWDRSNPDILLGGIALMYWDGQKIVTEQAGNKAAGTGAKVGTVVGVAAGILTGGVGLIGAALVGMTGGALVGALKKKGIKITEEQLANITDQIKGGKFAVVVMADENEVNPTAAVLEAMGGATQFVPVSADAVDEMQAAADVANMGNG